MNSVLAEIYATILPSAPYVIGAYALMWVIMLVYIIFAVRRFKNVESQLALVEKSMDSKPVDATASVLK